MSVSNMMRIRNSLVKYLVHIVTRVQAVDDVCLINFALRCIFYDAHIDTSDFVTMVFDRRNGIFKMLFDTRSELASFADEQQFILLVIEHVDAAQFAGDEMEIGETVDMAELWIALFCNGDVRFRDRDLDQVVVTSFFDVGGYFSIDAGGWIRLYGYKKIHFMSCISLIYKINHLNISYKIKKRNIEYQSLVNENQNITIKILVKEVSEKYYKHTELPNLK